jgi:hypothetical protein
MPGTGAKATASLPGLEIGTSQGTLRVVVGRFRRPPHIGLSGAFLAFSAQIATVGLVGGFREEGAFGAAEEPAGFPRNTRALRVLRYSGPVKRKSRSLPHHSPRYTTRRASTFSSDFSTQPRPSRSIHPVPVSGSAGRDARAASARIRQPQHGRACGSETPARSA